MKQITDLPNVGPAMAEKLVEAGFKTILSIAASTAKELGGITGSTEPAMQKLITAARGTGELCFETGDKVEKMRAKVIKLNTGSEEFNKILEGGFETGCITECFGSFGSSKTQIAHQLAINVQLPKEKGGCEGKALFIDTENTFRPARIKQMAIAAGLDPDKALKNVLYGRAHDTNHQMALAEKAFEMVEKDKKIKVIIVDSLTAHFRAEYIGRGTLSERQQKINKHMHVLSRIASTFNVCVYVTNQVMAKPDVFFGDPTAAIGGHIVGHNCHSESSIVMTPQGLKEMKELKIGDEVYNGSRYVQVLNVSKNMKKTVYEIKTNGLLESTQEHIFPIELNGTIKDRKVKNLKCGDLLLSTDKISIKSSKDILLNPAEKHAKLSENCTTKIKLALLGNFKNNKSLEKITGITIRQLRRIINQNYLTNLKVIRNLINFTLHRDIQEEDYYLCKSNKHRNINIPEKVNANFLRVYAAWLCDGAKTCESSIIIRKQQEDHLKYLLSISKNEFMINGKVCKIKDKNCHELIINSVELVKAFRSVDFKKIALLDEELIKVFCASMIDGDGSVDRYNVSFSQVNKKMMDMLQMLLLRVGVQSKLRKFKQTSEWSKSEYVYELRLVKNRGLVVDYMMNIEKKNKYKLVRKERETNNKFELDSKILIGKKNVVDISVEGKYFLVNGIISHNSAFRIYLRHGKKGTRVAKLVDSPNLPDASANFMIVEGGVVDV